MAKSSPLFCSSPTIATALGEIAADIRRNAGRGVLSPGGLAISLAIGRKNDPAFAFGAYRGAALFYPASIVKSFFMAAIFAALAAGRLTPSTELDRALRDMIGTSSNDATHYVVDRLTGTTSGPELDSDRLRVWLKKRRRIEDWFRRRNWPEWQGAVLWQKTFEDGPYGREAQSRAAPGSRNALSTDLVARLMGEIASRRIVSPSACRAMLKLMRRDLDLKKAARDPGNQILGFFGEGLAGRKWRGFYSKAGHTSWTRHDSAILDWPDGRRMILVAFTEGNKAAADTKILPEIARRAVAFVESGPR